MMMMCLRKLCRCKFKVETKRLSRKPQTYIYTHAHIILHKPANIERSYNVCLFCVHGSMRNEFNLNNNNDK